MKHTETPKAAILLGLAAFVALAAPALARPSRHHHYRHTSVQAASIPAQNTGADRDDRVAAAAGRSASTVATRSYASVGMNQSVRGEAIQSQAYRRSQAHANSAFGGLTSNTLVTEARKYIGTNPTGRASLWCGAFMDMVLKRTGHAGGGNLASAYARYGTRVAGPQVGAIAVMGRKGGGHVGVVSGLDPNGNPIIISGNHNHTTAESVYPRSRVYAYVMP